MQQPLQITFRGVERSEAVEQRIQKKVAELEHLESRITSCRVTVDAAHRRHHQGNAFEVRIELHLPDKTIVTSQAHEDVYIAVRDSFEVAVRELRSYAQRESPREAVR